MVKIPLSYGRRAFFMAQHFLFLFLSFRREICHHIGNLFPPAFNVRSGIIALQENLVKKKSCLLVWVRKTPGEKTTERGRGGRCILSVLWSRGDVMVACCYFTAINTLPLYLSRRAARYAAAELSFFSFCCSDECKTVVKNLKKDSNIWG